MQGDFSIQRFGRPIPDVLSVVANGEVEHLVEIAVIERPVPPHTQGVPTHDTRRGRRIERLNERFHVILVIATGNEKIEVAADRQVRDGQEVIEHNVVLIEQFRAVTLFEGRGVGGQEGSGRVVDQIQHQPTPLPTITHCVQATNRVEARRKYAIASLAVGGPGVRRWQAAHHMDSVFGEPGNEGTESIVGLENGQVGANNDVEVFP